MSATSNGLETRVLFAPFEYPFTELGHINYVTASMAMLFVSQMGYIHVRHGIESQIGTEATGLTVEDFFAARDQGNIVFGELAIRFKKRIPSDRPFQATMTHSHAKCSPTAVISHFTYSLDRNAAFGTGTCFILIR